ncbi:hypothetical protein INS49_009093 [Diaporthe citri]|uniref:uncharacterized protein n=1 Tax=Diaporthe citri TaxID=83186 RepID=UPI001C7E9311|nr:uncharacterized protein INS49_009093 [Diaporthe citri]KAG6363990.1 hypothetical protein INS49_009093 [Diaporthe citri]
MALHTTASPPIESDVAPLDTSTTGQFKGVHVSRTGCGLPRRRLGQDSCCIGFFAARAWKFRLLPTEYAPWKNWGLGKGRLACGRCRLPAETGAWAAVELDCFPRLFAVHLADSRTRVKAALSPELKAWAGGILLWPPPTTALIGIPSQADVSTDYGEVTDPENYAEYPKNDVQINAVPTSSDTAFFRVRTNIALKARKDKTNVFLSIYPERIQSVAVIAIHAEHASVVVPKGDLKPKQRSSGLLLDSLRGLAEQTSFRLHLPTTALSKAQLESLCKAASSGALPSMEKLKDVASPYGGRGGRIIQPEPQPSPGSRSQSDCIQSGTKRRRASSGAPASHKCVSLDVQTICSKMIERIDQGFGQLHSRMDLNSQQHSSEQADELRDELEKGL